MSSPMRIPLMLLGLAITSAGAAEVESRLREEAAAALQRGVTFFRTHVAIEGTYLWQYSEDLTKREGEGRATSTQGWVQPPGTPSVGLAFLAAWQATSNRIYLEAIRETALGLVRGQLRSGGWTYSIDFSAEGRSKAAYRDGGRKTARNVTTLDDDTTQAALRFLLRADEALRQAQGRALHFTNAKIHEAVEFGLKAVVDAQYPNGAWPQGFDQPPKPGASLVKPASPPVSWPRTWPGSGQYWLRYTLNDNAHKTTIETLFEAERVLRPVGIGDSSNLALRCRAAAEKAGDFLLLAQLPEPQPAWAQQYDFDMHPSWARKFEPPAVTGGESQGVLRTLLLLYRETGQDRFLAPFPRALAYLARSRLPDGRLARFYELGSNKPLYFTRDYQLTHDDGDLPTHYAFKVADGTDAIAREYDQLRKLSGDELRRFRPAGLDNPDKLHGEVIAVIAAQDARGRWVEEGRLRHQGAGDPTTRVIRSATFVRNVELLSRYLSATRSDR